MKKDERYLWKKSRETNRVYRNVSYRVRRFRHGDEAKYEPVLRHASLRVGLFEFTFYFMSNIVIEMAASLYETVFFDIDVGRAWPMDYGIYTLGVYDIEIQRTFLVETAEYTLEGPDINIGRSLPLDYAVFSVVPSEDTDIYPVGPGIWVRLRYTRRAALLDWFPINARKENYAQLGHSEYTVSFQDATDFYKQGEVDTGTFIVSGMPLIVVRSIIRQLSYRTITTTFSDIPFSNPSSSSYSLTWGTLSLTNPTRVVLPRTYTTTFATLSISYNSRATRLGFETFNTSYGDLDITSSFSSVELGYETFNAAFGEMQVFTHKLTVELDFGDFTLTPNEITARYSVFTANLDTAYYTIAGFDIDASISIMNFYTAQLDFGSFMWEETDWAVAYIDRKLPLTDYELVLTEFSDLGINRHLPELGYTTCTTTGISIETARFRHGIFTYTGSEMDAIRELPISYIVATGFNADPYIQLYKVS